MTLRALICKIFTNLNYGLLATWGVSKHFGFKAELNQIKNERDQYKAAYEQLAEQNANVWGMYSNLIDYVANQTTRNQAK